MAVSPGYPRRMPFIASIIAGFSSKHGASPSFQKQRGHLFHLFYQVQIRLGSPRSNSHCFTSSAHPAPRIGAFPKFNETRTLWQF
jgi:hypothetical protein